MGQGMQAMSSKPGVSFADEKIDGLREIVDLNALRDMCAGHIRENEILKSRIASNPEMITGLNDL